MVKTGFPPVTLRLLIFQKNVSNKIFLITFPITFVPIFFCIFVKRRKRCGCSYLVPNENHIKIIRFNNFHTTILHSFYYVLWNVFAKDLKYLCSNEWKERHKTVKLCHRDDNLIKNIILKAKKMTRVSSRWQNNIEIRSIKKFLQRWESQMKYRQCTFSFKNVSNKNDQYLQAKKSEDKVLDSVPLKVQIKKHDVIDILQVYSMLVVDDFSTVTDQELKRGQKTALGELWEFIKKSHHIMNGISNNHFQTFP